MKSAQRLMFATSGLCGGLYFVDHSQFDANKTLQPNLNLTNCDAEINNPNEKSVRKMQDEALQKAITTTKNLVWSKMCQSAVPGLIIGVSVDGKTVYRHGNFQFPKSFFIYSFNKKFRHVGTKTMQLWIISLAWASVLKGCFLLEIYSLTILLQFLIPKINN